VLGTAAIFKAVQMKRFGLPLLVIALAMTALTVVTQVGAVSDSHGDVSFHPFTVDPNNGTCVPWVDPTSGENTRNCDPVNLLFMGATPGQVQQVLGWGSCSGSTQWLHFDSPTMLSQDLQVCFYESFTLRYHMRLWEVPGTSPVVSLGAVHHESGFFTHTIDKSWEDSEAFVANELCASFDCSQTNFLEEQSLIQGDDGEWRGWANNASATIVVLGSAPAPTSTHTPSPTPSTPAASPTATLTPTPTSTPTGSPTATLTSTSTFTPVASPTATLTPTSTSTPTATPVPSEDAVYVSSIVFESRERGRGGANHDERVSVNVLRVSDNQPVSGAWVTVEVWRGLTLIGAFTLQTNDSGDIRTGWLGSLPDGVYQAEVTAVDSELPWDKETGQLDGDGDGYPDESHIIPHQ
jgi:hypothetical protein